LVFEDRTMSRMPGGYSDSAADFDPAVLQGLKAAGVVHLVFAVLQLAVWAVGATPSFTVIVDVILGVQLLRLRHSWKLWALIRAWVTMVLATFSLLAFVASGFSVLLGVAAAVQLTYAGSVILLLTGVPSSRALLVGRVGSVVAVILFLLFVFWSVALTPVAPDSGELSLLQLGSANFT
jgi:hypothetical protein